MVVAIFGCAEAKLEEGTPDPIDLRGSDSKARRAESSELHPPLSLIFCYLGMFARVGGLNSFLQGARRLFGTLFFWPSFIL